MANFNTVKIDFPIGHFMLPLLMLTLEVLSLSIHYFDKYLDRMLGKFENKPVCANQTNFFVS